MAEVGTTKVRHITPWHWKVRGHSSSVIVSALGTHIPRVPNVLQEIRETLQKPPKEHQQRSKGPWEMTTTVHGPMPVLVPRPGTLVPNFAAVFKN